MNCNIAKAEEIARRIYQVSIPNRDFDELQLDFKTISICTRSVSIPNRDFDELQRRAAESQAVFSFQGAVARFKGNHSIREFVWEECRETLKAETQF